MRSCAGMQGGARSGCASAQGGSLAQHISFGTTRLTISSRLTRLLLTLARLPGYLFNLVTFRAQQIMLGNTVTKLVRAQLPRSFTLVLLARTVLHVFECAAWPICSVNRSLTITIRQFLACSSCLLARPDYCSCGFMPEPHLVKLAAMMKHSGAFPKR